MIEQSLAAPTALEGWRIAGRRRVGAWDFLLVAVPAGALPARVALLQEALVADDAWYAHFFRGDLLVVVFRDAAFRVTVDPASWDPPVRHGLRAGIPREQLDFRPRTAEAAAAFFALG